MGIWESITLITGGSILIPLLVILRNGKNIFPGIFLLRIWIIWALMGETFSIGNYYLKIFPNSLPGLHLFTLLEALILLHLYQRVFPENFSRRLVWLVWGGLLLFEGVQLAFFQGILDMNANTRAVESLLIIGCSLYYFFRVLRDLEVPRIQAEPMFWVSAGLLVYFAGNLFLFALSAEVVQTLSGIEGVKLFIIHALLNFSKNILVAIGIWQASSA